MITERKLFEDPSGLEGFLKNGEELYFDSTICNILKELKFNYKTKGNYSKRVLVCRIEDNIDMIKKHCINEKDADLYFMRCFPAIAFVTRKIKIPDEFIEKNDVKPWHVSLIRRTLFGLSISNNKQWSYTNSECEIYLGDKRPYGNSNVCGDIAEEYFKFNPNEEITYEGYKFKWKDSEEDHTHIEDFYDIKYGYLNDNEEFFWNIMNETNDIIKKMLKEIDCIHYRIIKDIQLNGFDYYTDKWKVCETSYKIKKRENKLENLIGNE